jgi:uncharacterized protein
MLIELLKPRRERTIRYRVEPVWIQPDAVCARAVWSLGPVDLTLFSLQNGDVLHEYFYRRRWYNIFAVADRTGQRKGWYCNLARPAEISPQQVSTIDLELDLVIGADRIASQVLDEDDYRAAGFDRDPQLDAAVRHALAELRADAAAHRNAFADTADGSAPWHS